MPDRKHLGLLWALLASCSTSSERSTPPPEVVGDADAGAGGTGASKPLKDAGAPATSADAELAMLRDLGSEAPMSAAPDAADEKSGEDGRPGDRDSGVDSSGGPSEFPIASVKAAQAVRLVGVGTHVEGPSWREDDVFFAADNMGLMRATRDGKLYKYHPTLNPVGSYLLADGSLLVCEKKYIVVQVFRDGQVGVIVGEGRGAGFCNDVTVDGDGNIYFTDAKADTIFRVSPAGEMTKVAGGPQFNYPNGLEVDPSSKYLYFSSGGLWRIALPKAGGSFPPPERAGGPDADGMAFDVWGNLWLARVAAGRLAIFDPVKRAVIAEISAGGAGVTNLTFGGPDRDVVFTTLSGKGVWRIPVGARGFLHSGAPKYTIRQMLDIRPANELAQ